MTTDNEVPYWISSKDKGGYELRHNDFITSRSVKKPAVFL